jgi:hypothetical protein
MAPAPKMAMFLMCCIGISPCFPLVLVSILKSIFEHLSNV